MNSSLAQHTVIPALAVISAMITPALLILASGSLISSTLMQHGRVVDRARALMEHRIALKGSDGSDAMAFITHSIGIVSRRLMMVQLSLLAYYLAAACFIASTIAIAYEELRTAAPQWLATTLVVTGALLLLVGSVYTFLDTFLSTQITRHELDRDVL